MNFYNNNNNNNNSSIYPLFLYIIIELHSGTVYFRWSEDIFVHMMYQCYIVAKC